MTITATTDRNTRRECVLSRGMPFDCAMNRRTPRTLVELQTVKRGICVDVIKNQDTRFGTESATTPSETAIAEIVSSTSASLWA